MPAADYEKLGVIGEGTFGVVHRARHKSTGKLVAVKKMRSRGIKSGIELATVREIMLLQELHHPNVIELCEVYANGNGTSGAALHLVSEFCVIDLERVIKDQSVPLDAAAIKSCMLGTLSGLAYCHKHWVLHRDLKPGNLLMDAAGTIKLADFGLARQFGSPTRKFTGQVVTRWYRAPELLFGAKFYGPPIDLWSAGMIFAELMLRVPYVPGISDIDQLSKIFTALGTPSEDTWPGVRSLPDYIEFKHTPPTPLASTFTAASADALALLSALLTCNPSRRPTADEALAHAYFAAAPAPVFPPNLLPKEPVDVKEERAVKQERAVDDVRGADAKRHKVV